MLALISLLAGLGAGWIVNRLIERIPLGFALRNPRICDGCGMPIPASAQIPGFGWFLARGTCGPCGKPLSLGYPVVELFNGLLWLTLALRVGKSWTLLALMILFSVLLALGAIDLELSILPNALVYPALIVSVPAIIGLSCIDRSEPAQSMLFALGGAAVYFGVFLGTQILFQAVFKRDGIGMGDLKLGLLCGMWVGWVDISLVFPGLLVACMTACVAGVFIYRVTRNGDPYPFGPWLVLGTMAAILVGW